MYLGPGEEDFLSGDAWWKGCTAAGRLFVSNLAAGFVNLLSSTTGSSFDVDGRNANGSLMRRIFITREEDGDESLHSGTNPTSQEHQNDRSRNNISTTSLAQQRQTLSTRRKPKKGHICEAAKCTCEHGTPAKSPLCEKTEEFCISCNSEPMKRFALVGKTCVKKDTMATAVKVSAVVFLFCAYYYYSTSVIYDAAIAREKEDMWCE